MPLAAGRLTQPAQFYRRTAGAYVAQGPVQWGCLEFERAATITVVGVPLQGRAGRLTVRDNAITRALDVGDRVDLGGHTFSITIRKLPERSTDDVRLEVESAPTPALYAAEVDRRGEVVSLRRRRPNSSPPVYDAEADVRAIVTGYAPSELVGGIDQGDSRVILLAADVAAGGFPSPIRSKATDVLIINGLQRTIQVVDDLTHRVAGTLLAYDCRVRG